MENREEKKLIARGRICAGKIGFRALTETNKALRLEKERGGGV